MIEIKFFSSSVVEDVASKICDEYCKYPEQYDEEKEGEPMVDKICSHCPLVVRLKLT